MDRHPSPFGVLLRRFRLAAGLTQEELAEQAHLSARAITDLERGVRRVPRRETVALLATALNLGARDRARLQAAARGRIAGEATSMASANDRSARAGPAPIVGRIRELAIIARQLEDAAPPLLLLAGEPGIGKSCLLQEAVRLAAAEGWQVLQGGCQRRGGEDAFAPIVAAIARHIRGQPAGRLRLTLQRCGWLVRVLPELVGGPIDPLPSWTLAPGQERRLIFEAVLRYLEQVASPAGTLLVLDDLQWAGADGIDLLAAIMRNPGSAPVRVIGAYRDNELSAQAPLNALLADLAQAGMLHRHHLTPLTSTEAAHLFDRLAPNAASQQAAARERVLRLTGGVPFFVTTYAQELAIGDDASGDQAVPWSIGHSVRQRLAALSAEGQTVVGTAAVLGRVVRPSLLAAVATRPEHEVAGALTEACAARLLIEHEDVYGFAHDVIREVVESDLGAARRQLIHRRAVAALERMAAVAAAEALAYHAVRSGDPDLAVRYLEQAGDHARAQAAHLAAEQHFQAAVTLLDRQLDVYGAARVREKLAAVLRTATRYADALSVLERLAETHREHGDLEEMGRIVAESAWVQADGGTPAEGLAHLEMVLEALAPRASSRVLAGLFAARAYLLYLRGRFREQLAAAEQAERHARAANHTHHLAEALLMRGLGLFAHGRLAEAREAFSEAIPVAGAAGIAYIQCFALMMTGSVEEEQGAFEAGRQLHEQALRIAERRGEQAILAFAVTRRGMSAFYLGDWESARQDYARAVAIGREFGLSWSSVYPVLDLARFCLAEGDWARAGDHLAECERLLRSNPDVRAHADVGIVLAERDILEGHPESAHARMLQLLNEEALQDNAGIPHVVIRHAWALLAMGEVERAAAVVARVIARTRDEGRFLPLVDGLRIAALAAIQQERWEDAEDALEEGLSLVRRLQYPYPEARFLQANGELLVRTRQPGPARERLEAALAIFQRLGACKDAERIEQMLTALS